MRIERWFWLPIFCVISMLIHFGVVVVTRLGPSTVRTSDSPSIEVAFEPAARAPLPKPQPKVAPPPKPRVRPSVARGPRPAIVTPFHIGAIRPVNTVRQPEAFVPHPVPNRIPAPAAPKVNPIAELPENIRAESPITTPRSRVASRAPVAIHRTSSNPNLNEGGGSPSPAPIPGGHGGLNAPETPKEDVLYTGGGRGGEKIPTLAPTIGGGGGLSILHVKGQNPLGDALPEDKPGIGPGSAGGLGTGSGGGIGYAKGKGIGTDPGGKVAIGSLRKAPGSGIGAAASGSEVGTKAPGGGRGRGAELPGSGGTGTGYGRGHGIAVGDGADESGPPARTRGVPFGNVAGLLGGGNGTPNGGGPGRGAVFGTRQGGGGEGAIHIVYALDISGSMRDGHKIDKAKEALKTALGTLRRSDTFNIIVFKHDASTFREDSVSATPANVANARIFVDEIRIGDGTNISSAMDLAFGMNGITHIYLMSDGEPNGGIADFAELRRFIRSKNTRNIKVTTLALGLGENFPGMRLLKGIAEDNNGTYDYVNMAKIARPGQ